MNINACKETKKTRGCYFSSSLLIIISHLFFLLTCPTVYATPQSERLPQSRELSANAKASLASLAALKFSELGHPAVRWDSIPPVKATKRDPHQLLVVLVRFADLDFDRFKGETDSDERLKNFYQDLLFDPKYQKPNTLSHYFATQSYGQYHLQGQVLSPITLDHPRRTYGRPKRPEGGSWRNDSDTEGLVEEVLAKVGQIYPSLQWSDFDQWDPEDVDQDGIYEEPDGYLDHLVIVYAGGAQSSCQGLYKLHQKLNPNVKAEVFDRLSTDELECADRIWPHRFKVQRREGEGPLVNGKLVALGGTPISEQLWARDYNMQSEYTEPSTFIHEFGHSIGLPDVYARQTNNSTGPWELMSSTASPSPQGLSAWSRIMLGWLHPTVILPPEAGGAKRFESSMITLDTPPHQFERYFAPHVAETRRKMNELNSELIQPMKENSTAKSIFKAGGALFKKVAKDLEANPHIQATKVKLKRGADQVKRAVSDQINNDPDLKHAVDLGESTLKLGLDTMKEGLVETKKSLDNLAPTRALLIPLPPQSQHIELVKLEAKHGQWALYSGQGNELNRKVTIHLDLSSLEIGAKVSLTMDAWWQIEAGWDFAYLEVKSKRIGSKWERLVDPTRMTAKHGHDGPQSTPGFTGRSGDLDGDGKNESAEGCDPKEEIAHGEDKQQAHPCDRSTWSNSRFDLSAFAGQDILVRLRYFTDPAAVEKGILIDNLKVIVEGQSAPLWSEDFEGELSSLLSLEGFLKSSGEHHFEVPHFYVVEHRDPYAGSDDPKDTDFRYDSALGRGNPIFVYNLERERVEALRVKAKPGALIWYVNGRYAWSENEPTQNGQGKGFLLALDANLNEYRLPGLDRFYQGHSEEKNTHYDFSSEEAQEALKLATLQTICFVRTSWSYPRDLPRDLFYTCPGSRLPHLQFLAKTPMYVYEVINRLLPGEQRESFIKASELFDFKLRKKELIWSLQDRLLRTLHLYDAPFSSTPFAEGIEYLKIEGLELKSYQMIPHPARSRFSDQETWLNPHLRFGGVAVPSYGLTLDFIDIKGGVKVDVSWR